MTFLLKTVVKYLRDAANKIEQGDCNLTEQQAMDIMSVIANEELSKAQACEFLNVNRTKFGELVDTGKIPKGRKVKGFKELRWNKADLLKYCGNKFNP